MTNINDFFGIIKIAKIAKKVWINGKCKRNI